MPKGEMSDSKKLIRAAELLGTDAFTLTILLELGKEKALEDESIREEFGTRFIDKVEKYSLPQA